MSRFRPIVQSAILRALRTFTQAFLAQVSIAPLLNLDVPTLKAAAVAGLAAVLALVQRWLDTTEVPTIPPG